MLNQQFQKNKPKTLGFSILEMQMGFHTGVSKVLSYKEDF